METGITQADLASTIDLVTYICCVFAFFIGFLAGSFR